MGIDQLADRFQCEIWVDCTCTITEKSCEMMDFSRFAGFYDQTQGSTLLGFYEMLMYCGYRQKRRDRHMVFIYSTVRKYEDVCAVTECLVNLHEETVDRSLQFRTLIIESRYNSNFESICLHVFDLEHVCICEDRMKDLEYMAVFRLLYQKVSVLTYINACGGNDLFTDRIDRRVCYLCKKLFEIVE